MKLRKKHSSPAFTIVELLVVIVVIGILAAISIVSYNGIQNKAIASTLMSDLDNASKLLKMDYVMNSAYPATLAAANGNNGVPASSGTTYEYSATNSVNPPTFCVTATNGTTRYKITNNTAPILGDCLDYGLVLSLDAGNLSSYSGSGTTWTDLSGLGNNGSLQNGVSYSVDGGGTMSFDGVDDLATVNTSSSTNFGTGDFSIEAWIKFTSYGGDYRTLIDKGAYGGLSGWRFGLSTAGIPHILIGDTLSYNDSDLGTTPVGLNSWHYLTIVFNRSGDAVAYIDSVNRGGSNISTKNGSVDNAFWMQIGNSYTRYNGKISSIQIYNRSLLSTEITQKFNNLRSRYGL